jgi:hypothetical protein
MSSVVHTAQPYPPAPEPVMVHFGDILMSEHWLVTPHDTVPLAGTSLWVLDQSREERYLPVWAATLALTGFLFVLLGFVGFFFALLGLLFLLVKETRTTGFMLITVSNGEFTHQTGEPARGNRAAQFHELGNRAAYAREMIARAAA